MTSLDAALALLPEARDRYRELVAELWAPGRIDPDLLELCRVRLAQLLGDDVGAHERTDEALAAGLDEATVADVARWPTSDRFGRRERACLTFAELYVIDPHAVTDEVCAELVGQLGAPGATALTTALATFDAISRLRVALDLAGPAAGDGG